MRFRGLSDRERAEICRGDNRKIATIALELLTNAKITVRDESLGVFEQEVPLKGLRDIKDLYEEYYIKY